MPILPSIMTHTLLICVDKRERGIALQAVLLKYGYRTLITQSLYETIQVASQELPHLIITESTFADGNAGVLFDRFQENDILRRIPILTCVLKKSREELAPLVGRNFAGFLMGRPDPRTLVTKIREVLAKLQQASPFFLSAEACGIGSVIIARDATAIAKSKGFLIVASGHDVDFRSQLHCIPHGEGRAPAVLSHGVNLSSQGQSLNLFPLDRIKGPGRDWVNGLREINIPSRPNLVAVSLTSKEYAAQWGTILSGHGYQPSYRESLEATLREVLLHPGRYDCLLHLGPVSKEQAALWRQLVTKSKEALPTLIVITPQPEEMLPQTVIARLPCSLGEILHALSAGCRRYELYSKYLQEQTHGATALTYRSRVQFLGLDETGGYLQLNFPIQPGTVVKAEHPFFDDFFPNQFLTIRKSAPVPGGMSLWQARFEVAIAGQSKVKRWERLLENIAPNLLAS